MSFGVVREILENVGKRRPSYPWSSHPQSNEVSDYSIATEPSETDDTYRSPTQSKPLSDAELLSRARGLHKCIDFNALAAGPNAGGPWKQVEAANHFVLFRDEKNKVPEVLCAGRIDAAIEEIGSILCPQSEDEHNTVMTALHEKRFLFGSLERSVTCDNQREFQHDGEQLTVKTSSFARSSLFGNNEQWCYTDFFQRKNERDGFTVSLNSLGYDEATPAKMTNRVDQLHDLNASYLVDMDPGSKGLRVVFNAKFLNQEDSTSHQPASPKTDTNAEMKAQTRRLLILARGVTKLPGLVRSRRFGFQIPADLNAIEVSNPRCPCCTRSLLGVKMTLSVAASAISNRSLAALKTDTRRCYLCGYLVCIDCWTGERMESMSGRVAAIIVCRRCHASVDVCDYSDISTDRNHGPARVVADPPQISKTSLLVDFLSDSLSKAPVGSSDRSNVLSVVRTLLHQDEQDSDESTGEESEDVAILKRSDAQAVAKVDQFLRDESNFPLLEACKLGNAEQREYVLDLPDDPVNSVPRGPIPVNEERRLSAAKSAGLLMLADRLAPSEPCETPNHPVDVRDLELICQLAVKTIGCANAMISVMSASHEHILASTDVNFAGAAVLRDYTMCQHQLMSQNPLMLIHPEADVRLQAIQTVKALSLRSYIGFPVTAPILDDLDMGQIVVGTLCCIDNKPHHELTRSQYTTMLNLARTASQLMQIRALQLQQHVK